MSQAPVIAEGSPDPFTVVHTAGVVYNKTTVLPASQLVPSNVSYATKLKSALYFTGTSTALRTVTLPSTQSIYKTFTPAVGAAISVPIVNRGAGYLIFTGSDAYTTKPLGDAGGLVPLKSDAEIVLICTSVISSSNNTGSFTLY